MSLRLIPRLTLFTGSNCPLCDLAKIELNRVRQTRQFELSYVDIHAPENLSWKRKYVYWIPALHLEGQEIAKGRWDGNDVSKALDEWERMRKSETEASSLQEDVLPFVVDTQATNYGLYEPAGVYKRAETSDEDFPLGGPSPPIPDPYEARRARCFNCSETTHVLSACPYPVDKDLVALSRQYHEFLRLQNGADTTPRSLRELAERLERVSWTEAFVPGRVGPALRAAVRGREDTGDDDGNGYEWLANMALWGYPPGWVSAKDPREKMRARIMRETVPLPDEEDDEEVLKIWGDGDEEHVVLAVPLAEEPRVDGESTRNDPSYPERWARYPRAYFAWECLTIYNGALLSQRDAPQPPAPSTQPPPLPPPPPSSPPPPLPPPQFVASWPSIGIEDDGSEQEMDLSD
ncbi:Terpenoid synthase [Mycena chlorophos]|uniref:Terpenoid synthase n=1 Tax=Mycena chlorophos TaxID=658473 RepID=A0A8H6VXT0_MYCCL|nr:Terpenoid synthase [Mycena chlorophos]